MVVSDTAGKRRPLAFTLGEDGGALALRTQWRDLGFFEGATKKQLDTAVVSAMGKARFSSTTPLRLGSANSRTERDMTFVSCLFRCRRAESPLGRSLQLSCST